MDGNLLKDPMMSMMYDNALQALYAGNVMPFDRQILALAPLPDDVVDPFAAQNVDPNRIMQFTYQSLSAWIDEAKKANYLSKHFTDLSRLVLKGVNTMGRGLITLHNRGEDLARAPMQIGDLISVASYHFRKSYLGVMQTAASNPEVSERLLLNQLSWTNMLLRLYKTKDKLETAVRLQHSAENTDNGKLPGGASSSTMMNTAEDNTVLLHSASETPFSDVDALFEPSALSAPRALSSFDSRKKAALCEHENRSAVARDRERQDDAEKTNQQDAGKQTAGSGTQENGSAQKNGEEIKNPESGKPETGDELPVPEEEGNCKEEEKTADEEKTENRGPVTGKEVPDTGEEIRPDAEGDPDDEAFPDPEGDLPPYLNILQNVFARGQDPENGTITFTEYEMLFLSADPEFNRFYPETAAEFRSILADYDST